MTNPKRFVGRENQRADLLGAIEAKGRHAAVLGDRGVGKTSTVKYVAASYVKRRGRCLIDFNCSVDITSEDIAFKVLTSLDRLTVTRKKSESHEHTIKAGIDAVLSAGTDSKHVLNDETADMFEVGLTPDRFSNAIRDADAIVFLDEFDRVRDSSVRSFLTDTLKALSDQGSGVTFVIAGVSSDADELLGVHENNLRNVRSIRIPYMSAKELRSILENGAKSLKIRFDDSLQSAVVRLSCGLPYFAHQLGEELALFSAEFKRKSLGLEDLHMVLPRVLRGVSESISLKYHAALRVPQGPSIVDGADTPPFATTMMRRFVMHSVALTRDASPRGVARVARHLASRSDKWLDERSLDYETTQTVIDEMEESTGCFLYSGGAVEFSDPYLKAFTLMKSLEEHTDASVEYLLSSDSCSE